MKRALLVVVAFVCALLLNAYWVESRTRAAVAREGGQVMSTSIVPANVRVHGSSPVTDGGSTREDPEHDS